VVQAARSFSDRLGEALAAERGEAAAGAAMSIWGDALPPAYREAESASQAAADVSLAEAALETGRPAATLGREPGNGPRHVELRLAVPGAPLALADALPIFDSLDFRAIEEVPHRLTPLGREAVSLHVFQLEAGADWQEERAAPLLEALAALLAGQVEADGFNRLVLRAGLSWRECWLLRAMYRWLKQVGLPFAQESVSAALGAQPEAARLLVRIFRARFAPGAERDETEMLAAWKATLDTVADPDADRILSRMKRVLDAMLGPISSGTSPTRLQAGQREAGDMPRRGPGARSSCIRRRWRAATCAPGPSPAAASAGRPARGFPHRDPGPDEGAAPEERRHRADRRQGRLRAQGRGADGSRGLPGHRHRRLPHPSARHARPHDNLRGAEIVTPAGIVRRDGDDPYIVAAADKGTATFSDIANGLSAEYGFWLGDAFASGGSAGYDHKAMGITARGAWVMIERPFPGSAGPLHPRRALHRGRGGRHVGRRLRQRHADLAPGAAGGGLRPPARLPRPRARPGREPRRARAAVRTAPLLLGRLRRRADQPRRRRLPAQPEDHPAQRPGARLARHRGRERRARDGDAGHPAPRCRPALLRRHRHLHQGVHREPGRGGRPRQRRPSASTARVRARILGEGANLGITQAGRVEARRAGVRSTPMPWTIPPASAPPTTRSTSRSCWPMPRPRAC
jgi:glutamate dehydrogenase